MSYSGEWKEKDDSLRMDGFTSFKHYLQSSYVEILTFYGDFYDVNGNKFYKNSIITVADRHKLISVQDNPSLFGLPQIFHAGWRIRQDNLWAMGPLDNLVGMQYRIDHIENLKADLFDLTAFPPLKIKGLVNDFDWGPMTKIFVGDDGDVEIISPDVNALNSNLEIQNLQQQMEEMAGSPKEAMGFRTPGEKTAYEVQRLENAAGRIFSNKIVQFEEQIIEPLANAMLDLAKRNADSVQVVPVFDDETQATIFLNLTAKDISGTGKVKPVAARLFAERSERVQNLNNFFASALGQDQELKAHWSTVALSKMFEDLLDIKDYGVVQPYIRLSEQAEAQRMVNSQQEAVSMETMTPSGLGADDFDEDAGMEEADAVSQ